MSDKINDGGTAFPCETYVELESKLTGEKHMIPTRSAGMTLRDYFAAAALMSMLSQPDKIGDSTYEKAATLSFKFADAMLKAREVKP